MANSPPAIVGVRSGAVLSPPRRDISRSGTRYLMHKTKPTFNLIPLTKLFVKIGTVRTFIHRSRHRVREDNAEIAIHTFTMTVCPTLARHVILISAKTISFSVFSCGGHTSLRVALRNTVVGSTGSENLTENDGLISYY